MNNQMHWICIGIIGTIALLYWLQKYRSEQRQLQVLHTRQQQLKTNIQSYQMRIVTKKHFIRKWLTDAHFREQVAREHVRSVNDQEYVIYLPDLEQHEGSTVRPLTPFRKNP